jgi:uncharacterized protein (TIGR03435 family)
MFLATFLYRFLSKAPQRCLLAGCLLIVPAALAQVAPAPTAAAPAYVPKFTFDVISIRPISDDLSRGIMVSGTNSSHSGSMSLKNNSLYNLIVSGYGSSHIEGIPQDLARIFYYVEAKSDPAVDAALAKLPDDQAKLEKQHMVRVMLEERFHLKLHEESRPASLYELTVTKGGPKFHEGKPLTPGPDESPDAFRLRPLHQEGSSRTSFKLVGHGSTMTSFASILSGQFGTTVIDKTGLPGTYDFTVEYHNTLPGTQQDDPSDVPPLITQLQDQLGLKVTPVKGSMTYLVVDHIEKPSEN